MINNIDELINNGLHIIDFYAKWCGPCKMMENIIEELSNDYDVIRVDTDLNPKIVAKYRIMSIPTLLIIKDGNIVHEIVGLTTKEEILSKIKEESNS